MLICWCLIFNFNDILVEVTTLSYIYSLCPALHTPPQDVYESSRPTEQYRHTKRPTTHNSTAVQSRPKVRSQKGSHTLSLFRSRLKTYILYTNLSPIDSLPPSLHRLLAGLVSLSFGDVALVFMAPTSVSF